MRRSSRLPESLVAIALLATSAAAEESTPVAPAPTPRTLVATVAEDGALRTFARALTASGLASTLEEDGPFTVFAPTDEAFGRLPEGLLERLLRPESRDALRRVLERHVVPGRIASGDLLPRPAAATLAGDEVVFTLRVGHANVVAADVACSNGIVHAIDAVLLPSGEEPETVMDARETLAAAIDRGVPLFNAGDAAACARVYADAARAALDGARLGEAHAARMREALAPRAEDAGEAAWRLRRVFDRVLADLAFQPRVEAPMPAGFPGPGPVAQIVVKEYPSYRAARAEGDAFWTLFSHIKENEIAMTAPVEMTVDEGLRTLDMSFLYESTEQGSAGRRGDVAVVDLGPVRVLSLGVRGPRTTEEVAWAKRLLEEQLATRGLETAGSWRVLGYNSPMVPAAERFWELQVPIAP